MSTQPTTTLPIPDLFPELGASICIRIPGGFSYTGRLRAVYPTHVVIDRAAWIAESGRWHEFCARGPQSDTEVEPWPDETLVRVPRQLSEIADWPHPLPRAVQ